MSDKKASDALPDISVVIPLYNKAPYVLAALRSVQAQTFGTFEIIVVDDGSTDGGADLVARIDEPRLRLLRQANSGAGAARNTGIRAARGHWVTFLDADDAWLPERLARQLAVFEQHPDLVWAGGAYVTVTRNGPSGQISAPLSEAWFVAPDVVRDALVVLAAGWHIWTGTVMVERQVLLRLGGFESTLRTGQDLDLWVRLALRHPSFGYVRTPLARYQADVHGSLSNRKFKDGIAANLEIARRLLAMRYALGEPRAELLGRIACRLATNQAKNQLIAGQFREARATLATAELLGMEPAVRGLALATYLPPWPTASVCRLGIRLRQRWRGRAVKSENAKAV